MDARVTAVEQSVTTVAANLEQIRALLDSGVAPGVTEQMPSYMALIQVVNEGAAKQVQFRNKCNRYKIK